MRKTNTTAIGSAAIVMSAMGYASYGVWTKWMAEGFSEFNQAWVRAVLLLLVLVPFGLGMKHFRAIKKADWKWFAIVALAGGLNQAPYFYGYEHLEVGTGTLLFYVTLTLGTFLFGKFFFREKLTAIKYFSLALGVLGLSIIYTLVVSAEDLLPAASMILAGLMGAAAIVFTKKLSDQYSETQLLTALAIAMLPTNFALSALSGESQLPALASPVWPVMLVYLATYLVSNAAAIVGFKYLEASIAGLLGLVEVVFGVVLGVLVFGEALTPAMIAGSAIIILAAGLPDAARLVSRVDNARS